LRVDGRSAVAAFLVGVVALVSAQTTTAALTPVEAKDHVGESATVCGKIVSTRYASSSRGQPTFLNFGRPYPNHVFTVVIWGTDRQKFDRPEVKYQGKEACARGKIAIFRGTAEIIATSPSQLTLQHP